MSINVLIMTYRSTTMASSTGPGLTLINSEDIKLHNVLGEGGFGAVYKAKHVNWGDVAVKRLKGVT